MRPHELPPLKQRLTPARFAARLDRRHRRASGTGPRTRRAPLIDHATSVNGQPVTNIADRIFFGFFALNRRNRSGRRTL